MTIAPLNNGFYYHEGILRADGVPMDRIAADVETPAYIYSSRALADAYRDFSDAFAGQDVAICYAVKANSNIAVIRTLADLGAGADVVSAGEMHRALHAGVPANRIVFSGVGKTRAELAAALEAGIKSINVESKPELDALSEVAQARGVEAEIAIRVNPDVDAMTHEKITTGRKEDKFGIEIDNVLDVYDYAASLPGLRATGIAVHIGSQLLDLEPCRQAFKRVALLVHALRDSGHDIHLADLGGGLGITYDAERVPPLADYAALVRDIIGPLGCSVTLEPGRAIAGNAGVLLTRVIYVKQSATRTYAIVDAAMNDLLRPALYEAYHQIVPVQQAAPGAEHLPYDVVGPVCETGDSFAVQRALPRLRAGDLVAFLSAGAYGHVMASRYNTRPMPAEILSHDGAYAVVRPRERIEDIVAAETVPQWLTRKAAE